MRLGDRGTVWLTAFSLVGLVILVSLGNWQMRRLAWKEALIERVEARSKMLPLSLEAALGSYSASHEKDLTEILEFTRVSLRGRFRHDLEFHVWSPGKSGPAWSVITPLELAHGSAGTAGSRHPATVLVIRGSIPAARKAVASRTSGNPQSEVAFVGRVRFGHVGAFSNAERAANNEWYELDIAGMRKAAAATIAAGSTSGNVDEASARIAPFFIEAETPTGGSDGPQPELGKFNLTNRHLEYALTWYGLAVTLAGVYLAFVWSRWRSAG